MPGPRPEDIQKLTVVLTDRCNLRCQYCFQSTRRGRSMPWEVLRHALELLIRSESLRRSLVFYGGEPLLEPELIRRAAQLVTGRLGRSGIALGITTNGTLLDAETMRFLTLHRVSTQLSCDGIAPAQKLRGRGTHQRLDAVLHELRRMHPVFFHDEVSVAITLSSQAIPHLAASVAYLMRLGVPRIEISPLSTHDPAWSPERSDELDRQVERIFRASLRHFEDTGQVPFAVFRKTQADDVTAPTGEAVCRVGNGTSLAVDVDGQVYGCVALVESYQEIPHRFLGPRLAPMRLGHIADPCFAERLAAYPAAARAAELFDDRSKKHSLLGRCAECPWRATCSVCPVSIAHIPGNTDPHRIPGHVCAFYRVMGSWRERFPAQPPSLPLSTRSHLLTLSRKGNL